MNTTFNPNEAIFDGRPNINKNKNSYITEILNDGKIKLTFSNGESMIFESKEKIHEHFNSLHYNNNFNKSDLLFS